MLKLDEFESVFRSAAKSIYQYEVVKIESILFVTDLSETEANNLQEQIKKFCIHLGEEKTITWQVLSGSTPRKIEEVLSDIQRFNPDLIVTYRNLFSDAWHHPYSLGTYLDVMLQKISQPVLVLPHPKTEHLAVVKSCKSVMVVTDHMVDDHHLVSMGLAFLGKGDNLYLSHVEDRYNFERVVEAVSKIPDIDTQVASDKLSEQLLKEPMDYIASVESTLAELNMKVNLIPLVEFGHQLKDYIKYIDEKEIDLLVLNTKDGDQLAMHGLAYPLAIEVRHIPLLML